MIETINREASPVEKVAFAIQALTYGEMLEMAASLRDLLGDRISDGEEVSDSRTLANVLHLWAEAELSEGDPANG